jgi:hypothetical protein
MITTNDLTQMLLKDPLQRIPADKLTPGFWQQVQNNHKNKYGCTLPLPEIAKAIELMLKREDLYDLNLLLLDVVPNFNIFNERTCNVQALKPYPSIQNNFQKKTICYVENYEVAHHWFLGLPQQERERIRSRILNRLYQIQHTLPWGDDPFEWQLGQACLVERWQRVMNTAYDAFCTEYNRKMQKNGYISNNLNKR